MNGWTDGRPNHGNKGMSMRVRCRTGSLTAQDVAAETTGTCLPSNCSVTFLLVDQQDADEEKENNFFFQIGDYILGHLLLLSSPPMFTAILRSPRKSAISMPDHFRLIFVVGLKNTVSVIFIK